MQPPGKNKPKQPLFNERWLRSQVLFALPLLFTILAPPYKGTLTLLGHAKYGGGPAEIGPAINVTGRRFAFAPMSLPIDQKTDLLVTTVVNLPLSSYDPNTGKGITHFKDEKIPVDAEWFWAETVDAPFTIDTTRWSGEILIIGASLLATALFLRNAKFYLNLQFGIPVFALLGTLCLFHDTPISVAAPVNPAILSDKMVNLRRVDAATYFRTKATSTTLYSAIFDRNYFPTHVAATLTSIALFAFLASIRHRKTGEPLIV